MCNYASEKISAIIQLQIFGAFEVCVSHVLCSITFSFHERKKHLWIFLPLYYPINLRNELKKYITEHKINIFGFAWLSNCILEFKSTSKSRIPFEVVSVYARVKTNVTILLSIKRKFIYSISTRKTYKKFVLSFPMKYLR